jgi:hypothetical protein
MLEALGVDVTGLPSVAILLASRAAAGALVWRGWMEARERLIHRAAQQRAAADERA